MAATSLSTWVPVLKESFAVGREVQDSAVVATARLRNMESNQVDVPRFANADVGVGDTLTDDTNLADTASMFSQLFNGKFLVSEAEYEDSPADAVEAYVAEWLNSFNMAYDNASIGVTAARSGTASAKAPYTSIYKAVRTADTGTAYTADANYTATGTGGLTYANLNAALGKVEGTKFWTPNSGVVYIHPALRDDIRGLLGSNNQPIFVESSSGYPGGGVRPVYNLFGYPAYFTFGANTSSSFAMTEAGKPLIVFVNRQKLVHGNRIAPESRFINANLNTSALQHTIQARARKGFVLTVPNAASVLEVG